METFDIHQMISELAVLEAERNALLRKIEDLESEIDDIHDAKKKASFCLIKIEDSATKLNRAVSELRTLVTSVI